MSAQVPISRICGVSIEPIEGQPYSSVKVADISQREMLSWDRYVRLKACAEAIRERIDAPAKVLDVGGYDGALSLFLPDYEVFLIDPATTGEEFFEADFRDSTFEVVVAVDVLEHVEPSRRNFFLELLESSCEKLLVLNYPSVATASAQQIAYKATGNQLLKEHVEWTLPDSQWVMATLLKLGFESECEPHSSLAVWIGQYICTQLNGEIAAELNRYLLDYHSDEPFKQPLYDLIIAKRI